MMSKQSPAKVPANGGRIELAYDIRFNQIEISPQGLDDRWVLPLPYLFKALRIPTGAVQMALGELPNTPEKAEEFEDIESLLARALPDVAGKTVLDVGGYDGRFARLALDRGASRAICLDNEQWKHYGWAEPPRPSGVEYRIGDFLFWDEPVDVTLFYNVIYHCEAPRLALQHLRRITKEQMVLCSLIIWTPDPVWRCYEAYECNPDDDTVYWAPSPSGLAKLLKATGWESIEEVGKAVERLVVRCQ